MINSEASGRVMHFVEECLSCKDIRSLVHTAYRYFENPCVLLDSGYKVLFRDGEDEIDDLLWKGIKETGVCPRDLLNSFVDSGLITRDFKVTEPSFVARVYNKDEIDSVRKLAIAIPDGDGEINGWFIILESGRVFTEEDYTLLTWLKMILYPRMETVVVQRTHSPGMIGSVLLEVLNDMTGDLSSAQIRLESLHWTFSPDCRIMAIKSDSDEIPQKVYKRLFQFFNRYSMTASFVYNGLLILILTNFKKQIQSSQGRGLLNVLKKLDYSAGVSTPCLHIQDFRTCYKEALNSLAVGRLLSSGENLFYFEDYRTDILLYEAGKHLNVQEYCHPCLKILEQYDKDYHTDYFNTLFHYVQSGGNLLSAASELHIHRNTMGYRIEKIREIAGLDIEDRKLYPDLIISFRIMRQVQCLNR